MFDLKALPLHRGQFLTEKPCSVWLFATFETVNPASRIMDTFLFLRNPNADSKHPANFVHILGGGVPAAYVVPGPKNAPHVDLEGFAENKFGYYTGVSLHDLYKKRMHGLKGKKAEKVHPFTIKELHSEQSLLFSGYGQRQEVRAVWLKMDLDPEDAANLLRKPTERDYFPEAIAGNAAQEEECRDYRKNVAAMSLRQLMDSISLVSEPTTHIWSPHDDTPLRAYDVPLPAGKKINVQQSIYYCLQKLAKRVGVPYNEYVSDAHMHRARQAVGYPGGKDRPFDHTKYPNDPPVLKL